MKTKTRTKVKVKNEDKEKDKSENNKEEDKSKNEDIDSILFTDLEFCNSLKDYFLKKGHNAFVTSDYDILKDFPNYVVINYDVTDNNTDVNKVVDNVEFIRQINSDSFTDIEFVNFSFTSPSFANTVTNTDTSILDLGLDDSFSTIDRFLIEPLTLKYRPKHEIVLYKERNGLSELQRGILGFGSLVKDSLNVSKNSKYKEMYKETCKDYIVCNWEYSAEFVSNLKLFFEKVILIKPNKTSFSIYIPHSTFECVTEYFSMCEDIDTSNIKIKNLNCDIMKDINLTFVYSKDKKLISFVCLVSTKTFSQTDNYFVSFAIYPFTFELSSDYINFVNQGSDIYGCCGSQDLFDYALMEKFPFYLNYDKNIYYKDYIFLISGCT
jgi:hypothetical protein